MSTRAELKARARESIKGNIWKLFLALLLVALVPAIIGGISGAMMSAGGFLMFLGVILYFAVIVVALAASIGYTKIMMKVARNQEYDIKDTFNKDNLKVFLPLLGLTIVMCIFVTVASIVIIPGVILGYAYYFAPYMTIENGKGPSNLRDCRMMMKGHKWDLFVLDLSFIGWALLSILTLGILDIWLTPYMEQSRVGFFQKIKEIKHIGYFPPNENDGQFYVDERFDSPDGHKPYDPEL